MERNYPRFFVMLREAHPALELKEAKSLIALSYSQGRTESLSELTDNEFNKAFLDLHRVHSSTTREQELKKARRTLLLQLEKYGVDTNDWEAVDEFLCQPRIANKRFVELSKEELEVVTKKMRAINSKTNKI